MMDNAPILEVVSSSANVVQNMSDDIASNDIKYGWLKKQHNLSKSLIPRRQF